MLHPKLPDEIEIKLRIADRSAVIRRLLVLKAKLQVARVHEMNTLYDMVGGMLARRGQMLRVRVERAAPAGKSGKNMASNAARTKAQPNVMLTYKGPVESHSRRGGLRKHPYKIRTELEVSVSDADGIVGILEAIGFRPCFRYEKYRTTYRLPQARALRGNLKVEVDETPVGDFLELEGDRQAIDRAAKLLGYGPADYIVRSYGSLWLEYRQTVVDDAARRKLTPAMRRSRLRGNRDMLFTK